MEPKHILAHLLDIEGLLIDAYGSLNNIPNVLYAAWCEEVDKQKKIVYKNMKDSY